MRDELPDEDEKKKSNMSLQETMKHCWEFLTEEERDALRHYYGMRAVINKYGHEIGNHTISHPCACAFKENRSNCLETMTLEDIDWEVGEGKRRISEAIPIQDDFTFCYPCYHAHVGEGIKRQSYVPVVAKYHSAGRGKGDYANHPLTSDIHHLYSFPVERHALSEMIGLIEETAVQKRWVILTFHGISEGHLSVNKSDFKGLCEYLQKHNKRIWTAPVVNVSKAIGAWRIQKT